MIAQNVEKLTFVLEKCQFLKAFSLGTYSSPKRNCPFLWAGGRSLTSGFVGRELKKQSGRAPPVFQTLTYFSYFNPKSHPQLPVCSVSQV
jgi:hypothetical protein